MPLPLLIGIGALIAGATGVGAGVHGAVKMNDANDTMKLADSRHKNNIARFEKQRDITNLDMDNLGKKELAIIKSFDGYSEIMAKIQNKPDFKPYEKDGVNIPKYSAEELKKASIGAGVLLGGISGAAIGTAGGFAAAGAATAAVMALGTASTGTAIATLSGAAATNAALAALGGGAIAAGGGGIALGTTILGAATLGVGLLVGGVIFSVTGNSLSEKANEAWEQMIKAETEINKICSYLSELSNTANKFDATISNVNKIFLEKLNILNFIVQSKVDWNDFSNEEKLVTENTSLLVQLLYSMCKVQLVIPSGNSDINKINRDVVDKSISNAETFLLNRGL